MGRTLPSYTLSLYILIFLGLSLPAQAEMSEALRQAHIEHRKGYYKHIQKDYSSAIEWYEKGAAAGLAKSEYGIGRILAFDREDQHDYQEALPWIIKAVEIREQHQGQGFDETQKQANEALDWYCRRGPAIFPDSHPFSQDPKCWHGRAKALISGYRSVEKDEEAARTLLNKAIAAGSKKAQKTLDKLNGLPVATTSSPWPKIDLMRLLFILCMMHLAYTIMRRFHIRQRAYGLLYKHSD